MTARYATRKSLRFFTSAARIFSGLSFYYVVHAAFRNTLKFPLFVLIIDSTMLSSKGCAISASSNARAASMSFSLIPWFLGRSELHRRSSHLRTFTASASGLVRVRSPISNARVRSRRSELILLARIVDLRRDS